VRLEDGDRLARRDQRPGELLGELEERLDGADQVQAVSEEGHQLANGEPGGQHLPGAQPQEQHQEDTREQHAECLDHGLPDARGHPGGTGTLRVVRVVAAKGAFAADAPQDPESGDDVGGHRRQLGVARALDLLAAVQGP
jgi:hypothetical protein